MTKMTKPADRLPAGDTDKRFSPDYLLDLLTEVGTLMADAYDRRSRLSRNQTRLLTELLRHDGQTQTELANTMKIHKVSVGIYLNELESMGLIERRSHPSDRRAKCIYLTPLTHSLKHQAWENFALIHRKATDGIEADAYLAMLDGISLMRRNLTALDADDRKKEANGKTVKDV